jgi:hypothetical protein
MKSPKLLDAASERDTRWGVQKRLLSGEKKSQTRQAASWERKFAPLTV